MKAGAAHWPLGEDYGQEYARVRDPSSYFYLVVRSDSMNPAFRTATSRVTSRMAEGGDLVLISATTRAKSTLKQYIQRRRHRRSAALAQLQRAGHR